MDIQQIHYFLVCCQCLNYSKASRKLYISRQALSKAIHDLEKKLGEPLFISNGGDLSPTPFGLYLKANSLPVMESYQQLETAVHDWKQKKKNHIHAAIGLGALNAISTEVFSNFQKHYPQLTLSFEECSDREVREKVAAEIVNLGILTSSERQIADFEAHVIQTGQIYLQVNQAHPLARQESIEISDLKNQPFISLGDDNDMHNLFVQKCLEEGFSPNFTLITQDSNVANNMVFNNLGISFGHIQTINMNNNPVIRLIPLRLKHESWNTYAIRKKGSACTPATETLIRYINSLSLPRPKIKIAAGQDQDQ